MRQIRWRAEARTELATILDFIAERSPQSADSLFDEIERVVSQLPQHPHLYRLGRVTGTREIVVHPNYILVYRVAISEIQIVSVVHSRQQYP
jgi:addiction module RelE/StbE family toxin